QSLLAHAPRGRTHAARTRACGVRVAAAVRDRAHRPREAAVGCRHRARVRPRRSRAPAREGRALRAARALLQRQALRAGVPRARRLVRAAARGDRRDASLRRAVDERGREGELGPLDLVHARVARARAGAEDRTMTARETQTPERRLADFVDAYTPAIA